MKRKAISLNSIRDHLFQMRNVLMCVEAKGHDEQFNLTDLFLRAYLYQCMVTPLMKGQGTKRLD